MRFFIIIFCFIIFSCAGNNTEYKKTSVPEHEIDKATIEDDSLRIANCMRNIDTVLDDNKYIKYVVLDSFYDVKVGIKNTDTLLGFKFDCTTPGGLVPNYFLQTKDKLYLKRGYGQHFREVIICGLSNGKIEVDRFESEVAYEAKYDFAYKENIDDDKLILQDLRANKRKILSIPKNLAEDTIVKTEISKNNVVLNFPRDKKIAINF